MNFYIVIWFVLGACHYPLYRAYMKADDGIWTVGDRLHGLFLALCGPIIFLVSLICYVIVCKDDFFNKKAKW